MFQGRTGKLKFSKEHIHLQVRVVKNLKSTIINHLYAYSFAAERQT